MSHEHRKYLKNIKKNKFKLYFVQLFIFIVIVIGWQLLTDLKILDSFIISSPKKIIETIIELYKANNLMPHIAITIAETLISFVISMGIGIICASILWYFPFGAKVTEPYLTILNSLPKVALGPIILIWFGANTTSIVIMAILISSIVLIINIYNGFINIDPNKIKLFFYLILPSNIPNIISNLKICISMSLIGT